MAVALEAPSRVVYGDRSIKFYWVLAETPTGGECYPSTRFAPVPSLSGSTEAEAVAALGDTLCTVCFPSAPVKPSKVTEAQARKLLEEGEDAFLAARTKYLAKKES